MLLAADGWSNRAISGEVGSPDNQVAVWRYRYRDEGLVGLLDTDWPGRPPSYDADDVILLVKTATERPPAPASRWTMGAPRPPVDEAAPHRRQPAAGLAADRDDGVAVDGVHVGRRARSGPCARPARPWGRAWACAAACIAGSTGAGPASAPRPAGASPAESSAADAGPPAATRAVTVSVAKGWPGVRGWPAEAGAPDERPDPADRKVRTAARGR
ncbi:hypothetical protein [Rugosimonospora acidiphila]|uniref:hypothetical protein n=1 Tax=Rugosimonospora acidiphila TaxID=556531 RepID=UPI003CD0804B